MESRPKYRNWDNTELENENDLKNSIVRIAEKLQKRWNIDAAKIEEAVTRIRVQQRSGWDGGKYIDIDYDDMSMCIGHLFQYSGCHCALVLHEIRQFHCVIEHMIDYRRKDNPFKVVSLGGGPGTDILAFCKGNSGLFRRFKELQLHFTVVDLKFGWKEVFNEIMLAAKGQEEEDLNDLAPLHGLNSTWEFVQADLRTWNLDQIDTADVILMVKTLSNISTKERSNILRSIFASMKIGAVFLFIDTFLNNVELEVDESMAELLRKYGTFVATPIPSQFPCIWDCNYDVYALQKKA